MPRGYTFTKLFSIVFLTLSGLALADNIGKPFPRGQERRRRLRLSTKAPDDIPQQASTTDEVLDVLVGDLKCIMAFVGIVADGCLERGNVLVEYNPNGGVYCCPADSFDRATIETYPSVDMRHPTDTCDTLIGVAFDSQEENVQEYCLPDTD